jgi:hypothetical protein
MASITITKIFLLIAIFACCMHCAIPFCVQSKSTALSTTSGLRAWNTFNNHKICGFTKCNTCEKPSTSLRSIVEDKEFIDSPPILKRFLFFFETNAKWALTYADLTPYSEKDIIGFLFLSTNVLYFIAGLQLYFDSTRLLAFGENTSGEFVAFFSVIIDIAGLLSSSYHYYQLNCGPNNSRVIKALLLDYAVAFLAVMIFVVDLFLCHSALEYPIALLLAVSSITCLLASWKFEYGIPYMLLHGMWHILSAVAVIILHTM